MRTEQERLRDIAIDRWLGIPDDDQLRAEAEKSLDVEIENGDFYGDTESEDEMYQMERNYVRDDMAQARAEWNRYRAHELAARTARGEQCPIVLVRR